MPVKEHALLSKRDRQFSFFLKDNQDQNTQNISCHYDFKDNYLKPAEVKAVDIHVDFEITCWGFFSAAQSDAGSDRIGPMRYRWSDASSCHQLAVLHCLRSQEMKSLSMN